MCASSIWCRMHSWHFKVRRNIIDDKQECEQGRKTCLNHEDAIGAVLVPTRCRGGKTKVRKRTVAQRRKTFADRSSKRSTVMHPTSLLEAAKVRDAQLQDVWGTIVARSRDRKLMHLGAVRFQCSTFDRRNQSHQTDPMQGRQLFANSPIDRSRL